MRWGLAALALVLALAAFGFAGAYYIAQPVILRVAIAPSDSQSRQLFDAAAESLAAGKAPIRLQVVATETSLAALDKSETELAVARSVDVMRAQALTVAVLRQDAAVIMAPKSAKISSLPDLAKVTIGVVRESYMDGSGLAAVMGYYGIDLAKLKLLPLQAGDIAGAIRDKRIGAVVVAGNVKSKSMADVVAAAAKNFKGGVSFVDIEAAEAIAKRLPELEAIEIDQGMFGGMPPLPDDTVNTIGLSVRLVANARLGNDRVSDFLHAIGRIKQQLIARVPGSGGLSIPDPDDETAFALHQGVNVYNKGAVVSLVDRYGDQIYFGGLLASGLGSLCAGALGLMENRRRKRSIADIMQIEGLCEEVDAARSDDELVAIEARANDVFRMTLQKAVKGEIDAAGVAAFELAHGVVRDRAAARRAALADNPTSKATLVSTRHLHPSPERGVSARSAVVGSGQEGTAVPHPTGFAGHPPPRRAGEG